MESSPTLSPYLTVKGAKQAIKYYQTVFDAKLLGKMDAEDGERLMHSTLEIKGGLVMLCDEFPEWSKFSGPTADPISPVAISLRLKEPTEVDRIYNLALENGATSSWPPDDMFWGDRFCQIIDPFYHRWMLVSSNSGKATG